MGPSISKKSITRDFSKDNDSKGSDSKINIKSKFEIKLEQKMSIIESIEENKNNTMKEFANDPSRQAKLDDGVKNLEKYEEDEQQMNFESSRYPNLNGVSMNKSKTHDTSPQKEEQLEQMGEAQIQEQRLLGNQYYDDTNTLIGTDKLITSFQTNFLKDLSQSQVKEVSYKKKTLNQMDTLSMKKQSQTKRETYKIKEVEESDDDGADDLKDESIEVEYFNDFIDFDWRQAKFRPQKKRDTQTIFNMINALSCSQINYKSLQAQLNMQIKRNTKVRRTLKQSMFQSQFVKDQNK